jgi:acetylornithine deacetylase/succinyl-diaminopimelate desuccinylase-like protein
MDWPVAKLVMAAIQQTTKNPVLQLPTLGGSLPLEDLVKTLDTKFLIVPIANPDNNQHASDENIKLKNFWEGIDMIASVMMMKF